MSKSSTSVTKVSDSKSLLRHKGHANRVAFVVKSYVIALVVDDEKVLNEGDAVYIPGNETHIVNPKLLSEEIVIGYESFEKKCNEISADIEKIEKAIEP